MADRPNPIEWGSGANDNMGVLEDVRVGPRKKPLTGASGSVRLYAKGTFDVVTGAGALGAEIGDMPAPYPLPIAVIDGETNSYWFACDKLAPLPLGVIVAKWQLEGPAGENAEGHREIDVKPRSS